MKKAAPDPKSGDAGDAAWREAATTRLVVQLIHDLRNHLNSLVLEVTDLGEVAAEQGVELDTSHLMDQVQEAVEQLQVVRERLEVGPLRPSQLDVAEWVEELRAQVLEEPAYEGMVTWPEASIPAGQEANWEGGLVGAALGELLDNAADAIELSQNGSSSRVEKMQVTAHLDGGMLVLRVVNGCTGEDLPDKLEWLGEARGITGRRNKLGLGCAYANRVARAHGGECVFQHDSEARLFSAELRLPVGT